MIFISNVFFLDCQYDLTARSGVILSPNFPNNYPVNKVCEWNIRGNPGDVIKVQSLSFDLQKSFFCR